MYVFLRQGQKTIILVGVEIENLPTGNQVGVHIYGVHRVRYQHCVIHVEQIHNVAHIAFCSVSYEYLGGIQIHTEALIISGNGFPQEKDSRRCPENNPERSLCRTSRPQPGAWLQLLPEPKAVLHRRFPF